MKEIEAGHVYSLDAIVPALLNEATKPIEHILHFVRAEPPAPGPTVQEVLRACIARMIRLQEEVPCIENQDVIDHLRMSIVELELRAIARKKQMVNGTKTPHLYNNALNLFRHAMMFSDAHIEDLPTCARCGHIFCEHKGNLYE